MKILTREEEKAHYNETLKGAFLGGSLGLVIATAGVYAGSLRFPVVRHLTVPMKAFLVTSGTTFGTIISADHFSRAFETARNPANEYKDETEKLRQEAAMQQTGGQKVKDWFKEHRYQLVGGSWVASIAAAFAIVGRNPYLSTQQKIVQARVYAQGFTVLVMAGLATFEVSDRQSGTGRWETVKIIDPDDPEHKRVIEKQIHHETYQGEDQWRDMVETEERKLKERKQHAHELEKEHHVREKAQKNKKKSGGNGNQKKSESEPKKDDSEQKKDDDDDDEPNNRKKMDKKDDDNPSHVDGGEPRPANQP